MAKGGIHTLRFPMNPENVDVKLGAKVQTYNVLDLGDIEEVRGETVTGITWSGMFPGAPRKLQPYVNEWQEPNDIEALLKSWFGLPLTLLVTGTFINNWPVQLRTFNPSIKGGHGDVPYSIDLGYRVDRKLYTDAEVNAAAAGTDPIALAAIIGDSGVAAQNTTEAVDQLATALQIVATASTTDPSVTLSRDDPGPPAIYPVKPGDTLYDIARLQLGSGERWREIYALNKDVIGSNPDLIQQGQQLQMPGQ